MFKISAHAYNKIIVAEICAYFPYALILSGTYASTCIFDIRL